MTSEQPTFNLRAVHALLSRLSRPRLDPLTVDRAVAVVFTIVAQLEIWLGSSAGHHQLGAALITPAMTASIAVRRRYPMFVGVAVPVVESVEFAFWAGPNILVQAVANFCALYALTVWTPPRRFAVGFALVMTAILATSLGPGARLKQAVFFGLCAGVGMVLVRRGCGDRGLRPPVARRLR